MPDNRHYVNAEMLRNLWDVLDTAGGAIELVQRGIRPTDLDACGDEVRAMRDVIGAMLDAR